MTSKPPWYDAELKKSNYSKSFYAVPKLWRFGKHLREQITLLATGHGIKADDI